MKNNTYSITKEQILELANSCPSSQCKYDYLRELFPEAFEKKIKANRWIFVDRGFKSESKALVFYQGEEKRTYGFKHDGVWSNGYGNGEDTFSNSEYKYTYPTEEEVFEALKKEAVKRGYHKDNVHIGPINGIYNIEYNNYSEKYWMSNCFILYCKGKAIFKDGKWVEIIPTITKEEAEKELGKKII